MKLKGNFKNKEQMEQWMEAHCEEGISMINASTTRPLVMSFASMYQDHFYAFHCAGFLDVVEKNKYACKLRCAADKKCYELSLKE